MFKRKKLNNKGSLQDLVLIMSVLLFFAVVTLLAFKVSSEFNTFIQGSDVFESQGKAASTSINSNFTGVVDGTFLFLVVGLAIAAIALVFLVKINPIFLPFFIIGLIFIIFLSGILSNIYQEMSEDNNLSTEANQLTVIDTVLTYTNNDCSIWNPINDIIV